MTGSGCAADGLQPKLSAPGGGVCGKAKPASAPSAKSQLTGSVWARAGAEAANSAALAAGKTAAVRNLKARITGHARSTRPAAARSYARGQRFNAQLVNP